ncbi:hypothetical protein COLO4_22598 [Corchorus olitorius]|uniref:Uncharacterized protein n=1 Tax=Corchorus olitorius TaxID=93759 RepID=A0A1R3ILA1_9ROSI|nr:hypothetical protein COLO4_22598 [Corchorus olitorius]
MGKSSSGGLDNRQNNRDLTPTTTSAPTSKAKQRLLCFLCHEPHKSGQSYDRHGRHRPFYHPEEAKRCGLKVDKECGQMKAVNSAASTICGSAKRVMTKLGLWEGSVDLTVSA